MRVEYLGHACFLLADENFSVVIDPFKQIGYELENVAADFCLCSHSHYDHCATECVKVKKVITAKDYKNYSWLKVIPSFHDEANGAKRGNNDIFVMEIGGYKVCHLGDLGEPLNTDICKKIGKVDILLIPVGGNYTIDANVAYQYYLQINPKIVIPMHYKTKRSQVDIDTKDQFLAKFSTVLKLPNKINLTSLPEIAVAFDLSDEKF